METPGAVTLTLDDGVTRLELQPGQQVVLGRLHFSPDIDGAASVSGQQCRVLLLPSDGKEPEMMLESLGANPTVIMQRSGAHESLQRGAMSRLQNGDRIALLSTRPDKAVSVSFCGPSASSTPTPESKSFPQKHRLDFRAAAAMQPSAEPPERRQRLEEQQKFHAEAMATGSGSPGCQMWPIVLVLVGPPGSGKSTFAQALQADLPGRWTRVCQDVIAGNGKKRGTRPQCVRAVRAALDKGRGVIVDRCNFNAKQRKDFVDEARSAGVPAHCVVLQFPKELCIQRAAARVNHEGGVQGIGAKVVVARMVNSMKPPKAGAERLCSVRICKADRDVAAERTRWTAYAQLHSTGFPLAQAAPSQAPETGVQSSMDKADPQKTPGKNAFDLLMRNAKAAAKGKGTPPGSVCGTPLSSREQQQQGDARKIHFGNQWWCQALRNVALDPEKHAGEHLGLRIYDQHIVIQDKFPKARHHLLVVSRNPGLESLEDLRTENLQELREMGRRAQDLADELSANQGSECTPAAQSVFQIGLHAIPSMRQLHIHIISQDFDSPCLKNKKHWNSFTTEFFRPLDEVIRDIEAKGRLDILDDRAAKDLLATPLRCHKCRLSLQNMPLLKSHIASCNLEGGDDTAGDMDVAV